MPTMLGFVVPADSAHLGTFLVPETVVKLTVEREVAPILIGFARDFNREVEALIPGQCGGFNPRKIAGSDAWSRHAIGGALDLNWLKHPQGRRDTFTVGQRKAIDKILDRWTHNGVRLLRAGKDYKVSTVDDMHFELNVDRETALAAVVALQTPAKPKPTSSIKPGTRILKLASPTMRGEDVAFLRRWTGAPVGDVFDATTKARVIRYQKIVGLKADGVAGAATWSRILGRTIHV